MKTDNELLRRYVEEHSEAAFAELVNRHLTLVYSVALRQLAGDSHLAEDATQLVFTALARKARALWERPSLAGWLYVGAQHAAANLVRGEQRRRAREEETSTMHNDSSPQTSADWDRMRPLLDQAMGELRENDREAIILRFFEKRPFSEIGAALHQSEDAARMRVDRALDKLHAFLARRGVNSTTVALAMILGTEAMVAAPANLAASVAGAALTGAGAGSLAGTASASLFAMSKTSLVLGILAIAGIVGTEFGSVRARHSQTDLASAQRQSQVLQANLSRLEKRLSQSQKLVTSLRSQVAALAQPGPATGFSERNAAQTASFVRELEGRQKERVLPLNINVIYSAFYRQLGLTAAQQAQFKSIFRQNAEHTDEMIEAAATLGSLDAATAKAISQQSDANLASSVAASFGEAAGQSFNQYEETVPIRNLVSALATEMYNAEVPLTPTQADQLVAVIAANSRNSSGQLDSNASIIHLNAILAQSQGLLSPSQFEILRQESTEAAEAHR